MKKPLLKLLLLSFIVTGCVTTTPQITNTALIPNKSTEDITLNDELGLYAVDWNNNIEKIFKEHNYRYKMHFIDTRWWSKNKKSILRTREIIKTFGNNLGKKAIVVNLITKSSKKRAIIQKIQKKLKTHYNLDTDAPFLIFYKTSIFSKKYRPYSIISLSDISLPYLEKKLSLLSRAINSGKSNKAIYASLEKIKKTNYASNQPIKVNYKSKKVIEVFIRILQAWVR